MRLLVVSQYFWPESFIVNDLVRTLADNGHQVEVLTGKPNYPDGVPFDGYSTRGCAHETYAGGVAVHRVPLRPRGRGGAVNLLLNYLSFVISGLLYFPRMVEGRKFDVILVFAPSPITAAIPAIRLRRLLRCQLAIWIQDLWPESLKATGFVTSPVLLALVARMVKAIYARADVLLVQSRRFVEPTRRLAGRARIVYYPNSYRIGSVDDSAPALPDDLRHFLEAYECIVFAGNLGSAQGLETVVEAAGLLLKRPRCKLVIVGSGSRLGWLEREAARRQLDNVLLPGRFPPEVMPSIFERAAGLLVSLKRSEIFSYTIPSKIQAYLAAGRPIIAALDGEGARVVEEAGAGLSCPAEDPVRLAECIERLIDMSPNERDAIGQSGLRYYHEFFEMNRQCRRLIEILHERGAVAWGRDQ